MKNIVGFVKYGYMEYALHVDTVALANQAFSVRYTSLPLMQDMTSPIAHSIIITIYSSFGKVDFIENSTNVGGIVQIRAQ